MKRHVSTIRCMLAAIGLLLLAISWCLFRLQDERSGGVILASVRLAGDNRVEYRRQDTPEHISFMDRLLGRSLHSFSSVYSFRWHKGNNKRDLDIFVCDGAGCDKVEVRAAPNRTKVWLIDRGTFSGGVIASLDISTGKFLDLNCVNEKGLMANPQVQPAWAARGTGDLLAVSNDPAAVE